MDVLKQLSFKSLKLNRKRTVSTMIGIILSCSLICAVATMVTSFQETLVQNAINETGYWHLRLSDVTEENQQDLENNAEIKKIDSVYEIGYGELSNGKNKTKPYLKLYSMEIELFEQLKFNLVEGRFPSKENEVVISKHIIENGRVDYKIGDSISIEIGERKTKTGENLHFSNPYDAETEKLVETQNYEFTIVGIIERPNYLFESYGDPGYTILTTNLQQGKKQAYLSFKDAKKYQTVIPEILGASSYRSIAKEENLKYEEFDVNDELLRWEVFAFGDNTVAMLWCVAGVVMVIILFTSVFCIRNSFAIATTEKMKMYGMLASIGATRKQIKKSVIWEGMLLGMIGIPVGMVSGILAVVVLFEIVNQLLGDYLLGHVDGILVHVTFLPILLTTVLGLLTIDLSALSSARKASKVSPIDLLKNADEIKIKSKKLRTPNVIRKVFKIGGELAYKNLKRSKKKYRTTVVSLSVSIFIFIAMNSFLANMFDFTGNYYEDYEYNVKIYYRGNDKQVVDKIKKSSPIDEIFTLYENEEYLKIKDLSKINEIVVAEIGLEEDGYYDEETDEFVLSGEGKVANLQLLAFEPETFEKYAKKVGIKPERIKGKAILCDSILYYKEDGKQVRNRRYNYSLEETITGKIEQTETHFQVGAITEVEPYGMEKSYYSDGYLIVNLEDYPDLEFMPSCFNVQSSNPDKLIEELERANLEGVSCFNFEEAAKQERAMVLVVKIFLYGFIAVIALIGVTNIFNTITSNMELRQREFAMLKSIGMTKKEFNKMINLETIFYSSKALFYGIILGLIGTFALDKAFSVKIEAGMYLPLKPIGISILAVFVLVFVIMKYSMAKINRQNVMETIRNENI